MKGLFCFKISPASLKGILTPIRDRLDLAIYLLNVAKIALVSKYAEREKPEDDDTIVIHVGSRSRAYICDDKRIVSLAFPFTVVSSADSQFIELCGGSGRGLNSKIISQLQAMLVTLRGSGFVGFTDFALALDFAEDGRSELDDDVWPFFQEIVFLEDGYLRYDHDPARANGAFHPEHHIDAFYSNRAGVKLGLYSEITISRFQEIVSGPSGCHYLDAFRASG